MKKILGLLFVVLMFFLTSCYGNDGGMEVRKFRQNPNFESSQIHNVNWLK